MVDNGSSKRAFHSYATLIVQPVSLVTPSGRDDAAVATAAEVILHSETLLLAILSRTVDNPDTRMQLPMASPPFINLFRACSRCTKATSLDDSLVPNCAIILIERDKQLLAELRKASQGLSLTASSLAVHLRGSHQRSPVWGVLCRYRCRLLLAEVTKGTDRNAELKLRLRMWEAGEVIELISEILEQQHSGPLRKRKRIMQPQTDEQRGKRACALTARRSVSKAVKGLVGGAAQSSADCRKNGLQPCFHGTRAAELTPPVLNLLRCVFCLGRRTVTEQRGAQ